VATSIIAASRGNSPREKCLGQMVGEFFMMISGFSSAQTGY